MEIYDQNGIFVAFYHYLFYIRAVW